MPVLDVEKLIENRVDAIRKYHEEAGIKRGQLDVSGGIDSAVMLGLLSKALGPDNITAVYSSINSSDNSRKRAYDTSIVFGVALIQLDLTHIFSSLVGHMKDRAVAEGWYSEKINDRIKNDPTILGSIRSCLRAPVGRGLNRMLGDGIRHGTGNECEDRWLRFYQKGGDGEVDTNPLAMLSKGEVYQLAIGLGVPDSVLSATPSPDLQGVGESGHNDEGELKALTGVDWTYSKVYLEDAALGDKDRGNRPVKRGEYASVGTIERMSRLLDHDGWEGFLFNWDAVSLKELVGYHYPSAVKCFPDTSDEDMLEYFKSAKKLERMTRHKMNPNCPSLGNRKELVDSKILTDELPKIEDRVKNPGGVK